MSLNEESNFAMKVHRLLGTLQACGIGLVKLPEPHSVASTDVVDALREAVEQFARTEGLSERGCRLMHNYLSDHLFEDGEQGSGRVLIEKVSFTRSPSNG